VLFGDRLVQRVQTVGNPVVLGIDPRIDQLPSGWLGRFGNDGEGRARAVAAFGRELVDLAARRVPAVKFQAAFYEALGPAGMLALHETAAHAMQAGLIVILDGKRNDIGSTAEAYAQAYLTASKADEPAPWPADALTVNPYLGSDGILPFTREAQVSDKGIFVLVRTSNPSAREFQDLSVEGEPLYRHVARRLSEWAAPHRGASGYSLVGAVVGATYPDELHELRALLPGVWLLVPGYGSQGGTAADVAGGFDEAGLGALVNNSRGLAFAYQRREYAHLAGHDWRRAVEQAITDMIADLAANTPAGRLGV
jgi:orotidine-5'-phosphate decarboxylase